MEDETDAHDGGAEEVARTLVLVRLRLKKMSRTLVVVS